MKLTALALALVSSVSAYSRLDEGSFPGQISTGQWFVKFYSPTCPWSRRFAPTWNDVVSDHEAELSGSGISFGEVDCKKDRALCDAQGIDGYPTVLHYRNGANVGEVPGDQSYKSFQSYFDSL